MDSVVGHGIRIIDQFFDPEDLRHIEEHIAKQTFSFGHSSGANGIGYYTFHHR